MDDLSDLTMIRLERQNTYDNHAIVDMDTTNINTLSNEEAVRNQYAIQRNIVCSLVGVVMYFAVVFLFLI